MPVMRRKRMAARLLAASVVMFFAAATWASPWVQVYYTGWQQGQMPPSLIDFSGMTQLIHFAVIPNNDGTLDQNTNGLTAANVQAAVAAAHAAGKQILFSVGGYPSQSQFESAMSAANQANFVNNIAAFLQNNHYDGVDLDMEPISDGDKPVFTSFVTALRAKLNTMSPRPLLTTTALWSPATLGAVASQVDEVNIMSYSLSGPYQGWFTWHNAPVYSTGYLFPNSANPPPSADTLVKQFENAGVPASKLGIGFSMDPYIWKGVSYPGQTWTTTPPTASETAYNAIAKQYGIVEGNYSNPYYKWDANAQAPYLSITNQTPNLFISYDNEISAQMKKNYISS